ncbi:hypothetical protein CHS0354_010424 [Potamilus streckersoni]|uniref:Uncharacterized protein n=1 Tax=Potamilus streckersoni TaxID=2493646 RepID=A0AAE0SM17_9BIVA|nr:hypothetical protein CHS0354_010424 [Potamilus streckersoni]
MNKIMASRFFIAYALFLTCTFASSLDVDTNLDNTGQDRDQESKILAQFQDAMKRSGALLSEEEKADKESLSEDKSLFKVDGKRKKKIFTTSCKNFSQTIV